MGVSERWQRLAKSGKDLHSALERWLDSALAAVDLLTCPNSRFAWSRWVSTHAFAADLLVFTPRDLAARRFVVGDRLAGRGARRTRSQPAGRQRRALVWLARLSWATMRAVPGEVTAIGEVFRSPRHSTERQWHCACRGSPLGMSRYARLTSGELMSNPFATIQPWQLIPTASVKRTFGSRCWT